MLDNKSSKDSVGATAQEMNKKKLSDYDRALKSNGYHFKQSYIDKTSFRRKTEYNLV